MPTKDTGGDLPGPVAPAIPSFTSLRGPRRSSPVDVLVPSEPAAAPPVPRPAEWADLLPFGLRVLRAVAALPADLARRILGG